MDVKLLQSGKLSAHIRGAAGGHGRSRDRIGARILAGIGSSGHADHSACDGLAAALFFKGAAAT